MEPDQEPSIVMCLPRYLAPGVASIMVECVVCDEGVWVSEPLAPHVQSGKMTPICMSPVCLGVMEAKFGEPAEAAIHPDQRAQLEEEGILDFAEQFIKDRNAERRQ